MTGTAEQVGPLRLTSALLTLFVLLVGCDSAPTGPEMEWVLAPVQLDSDGTPQVTVPDTVRAGENFTVVMETRWPDFCPESKKSEVETSGLTAKISPFFFVPSGPALCGQAVTHTTHGATLRFNDSGTATVIVRSTDGSRGPVVTYAFPVVVE